MTARFSLRERAARVREEARRAWRRLRGGELDPRRAAISVAVGLCIGLTPLYGLHLPLILAICLPLRLDAPLAYLAAHVSLPFVVPFILLAEIELGSLARIGRTVPVDVHAFEASGVPFGLDLLFGTLILAPLAAVLGGGATYFFAKALKNKAQNAPRDERFDRAVSSVAARYAPGRRAAYHYVRSKLRSDPVMRALCNIADEAPLGEVLDVGCGRGQLALLLLEAGAATHVHGLDWDEVKVRDAKRAAAIEPPCAAAIFETSDAKRAELPACDTVLLVDVLHYLEEADQDTLIDRVAHAAKRAVLVRELDPDRGVRSAVTRAAEWLATRTRVNRGGLHARSIARIEERLSSHGFSVRVDPCWAGTPFSNVLVVARR